jgi:hypothetical protein
VRPCLENTHHRKGAGGVAQSVGPEFKPHYHKKRKKKKKARCINKLKKNLKQFYFSKNQ